MSGTRRKRQPSAPPSAPRRAEDPGVAPHADQHPTTWRPTAASTRNLAVVCLALTVSSTAVVLLTQPALLVAMILVLAAALGSAVNAFFSKRRVAEGLRQPEKPELLNWPGSADERRRLERAGRLRAANAATVALILGAIAGLVPAVGLACAGAGAAGATTAWLTWRLISRYEDDHRVTVFTAHGGGAKHNARRFGVAATPVAS